MRLLLAVISIVVGVNCGYEFALVLWIVGRIVIGVIAKGAESSARYHSYDNHSYRSSYQNSYQSGYQKDYYRNNESGGYQTKESSNLDCYYKVLGVSSDVSDAELKKAYRKKAMEYHPDRFANSSEEVRKQANEMFCKLNNAYEAIKQSRNLN